MSSSTFSYGSKVKLPDKFTLNIERTESGMWVILSDVHPGFFLAVPSKKTLAQGLAEVPEGLSEILYASKIGDI